MNAANCQDAVDAMCENEATLETTLELLIDKLGVPRLLAAIADVCAAKSAHVAVNWQDKQLAMQWAAICRKLAKVAHETPRL